MKVYLSALAVAAILLGPVQSSSALPLSGAASAHSVLVEVKAKISAASKKPSSKQSGDMKGMKQDGMKGMDHSKMKM